VAITNYGELKTALDNWLSRTDLSSRIPEFIALAEDVIAQKLKVRGMETSTDLTVDDQTVGLPTRFKAARRIYLAGDPVRPLLLLTPQVFWTRFLSSQTGRPVAYTIEGENFVFGPTPDISYTGKLLYYQRFAALSADGDTNTILSNYRGLLLFGALIEAEPFLGNDPRTLIWATKFDDLLEAVLLADEQDRFSGAPQVMQR